MERRRIQRVECFTPPLSEVARQLQTQLRNDFSEVEIEVADCPDLRRWGLAAPGLGGDCVYLELGCMDNLLLATGRNKSWAFDDIAAAIHRPTAVFTGAGACSRSGAAGDVANAEGIFSYAVGGANSNWAAKLDSDGHCTVEKEQRGLVGMMGNFLVSEGRPGRVLRIQASGRRLRRRHPEEEEGKEDPPVYLDNNFVAAIRSGLVEAFGLGGRKQMALGGVFRVRRGKVKAHVIPDGPLGEDGEERTLAPGELWDWLEYFEWEGSENLVCCSTLVTGDPTPDQQLKLRPMHTHFVDRHQGIGGHYHCDTTPEDVIYEGFFSLCEAMIRMDPGD